MEVGLIFQLFESLTVFIFKFKSSLKIKNL
jgi:hypothetical protein